MPAAGSPPPVSGTLAVRVETRSPVGVRRKPVRIEARSPVSVRRKPVRIEIRSAVGVDTWGVQSGDCASGRAGGEPDRESWQGVEERLPHAAGNRGKALSSRLLRSRRERHEAENGESERDTADMG